MDAAAEGHRQPWHYHPVGKIQEAVRAGVVVAHVVEWQAEPVQLAQPAQLVHRVMQGLLHTAPGLDG